MARRRRPEEVSISLFPFLSILACVIGVLTLVIMSLSLSQIAQGHENEDVARAEEGAALKKRIAAMREQIEELGKDKVAVLEKIKLEAQVAALKDEVPPADDDALEEKIAKLDRMIAAQTLAKQKLDEEQKAREDELAKFEALKKKPKVLIQPSGGSSKIRPQFVEVRKEGVVIHAISKSIPIKLADLSKNADYKKLVDYVQAGEDKGRTIVFLIRQDALGVFARARDVALAGGASIAKLPLLGEGPVDLAAFGIRH
jgi:hypothetical protein